MRIAIINTDYPPFLEDLYARERGLAERCYADQVAARNASFFGVADFYSHALRAEGHQAWELHANNEAMQRAWAREHGLALPAGGGRTGPARALWRAALATPLGPALSRLRPRRAPMPGLPEHQARVLLAQIEELRPDVVLNQALDGVDSALMARMAAPGRLMAGQIAAPLPAGQDYGVYRVMLSSLPNLVAHFAGLGLDARLVRLAFDPRVTDALGPVEPEHQVSFVGSLSADHPGRIALLEALCDWLPLKVWGLLPPDLPRRSPIRRAWQGRAWGLAVYRILAASRVTLNHHIAVAEGFVNNLRLYEATGVGSCLVTDAAANLTDMFRPGREVVDYADAADCAAKVEALLNDEPRRAAIAAAGRARTLADHTYLHRARELAAIFEELL